MPFGAVLKAAVLAGLVAGLAVSFLHSFLTEPVIDRAIEIEESLRPEPKAETVSRATQRLGLVAGFLLFGAASGLFAGLLYRIAAPRVSRWRGSAVCLVLGWSISLFPFLKYPANPPGVGDPETIGYRQALYLAFVALSALGALAAFFLDRRLNRRALSLIAYVAYLTVIYIAMPENPEKVRMPSGLLWTFRAFSFTGLVLFWGVLAVVFEWLLSLDRHR